jgi:hypothetical protein
MTRLSPGLSARTYAVRGLTLLTTICVLALVVASPFALRIIARLSGMNWARLSNIGQTYGAVSALLTALALAGVVISLLYQAHDVSIAREQARRTFHNELLRMELEDPIYMEALGAPWGLQISTDFDSLRQYNFIHMWVSFWHSRVALGEMSEMELRSAASLELFNSTAGRNYWLASRETRMRIAKGRELRFAKILDDEYHKALAKGEPRGVAVSRNGGHATKRSLGAAKVTESIVVLSVAAGFAMGRLIGRKLDSTQD